MNTTSFRLDWKLLLSDKRPSLGQSKGEKESTPKAEGHVVRTEFERDSDRVVFSSCFRRLAKKTQVHPFAEIDHVHNRLTHSLEVASVGRSLAGEAGRLISSKGEMPPNRTIEDLKDIVQTACFAHDIGNPPFGHAGESAIREWTKENIVTLFGANKGKKFHSIARDWLFFEGNAQGFRLVARPDSQDQAYFRFTLASLGAMIKYPWTSLDKMAETTGKCNAFSSEETLFGNIVNLLGLRNSDNVVVRHPLSFLTEVADDICYRITDFEDAVQMRLLAEKEVREIFKTIMGRDVEGPLSYMRALTISHLTKAACKAFKENYEDIMAGKRALSADLKSSFPEPEQKGLAMMKQRYDNIFNDRRKIATEFGAYNVLGKILSIYAKTVKSLSQYHSYDKLSFVQQRCIALAWGKDYAEKNKDESYEWWLSRVLDYVSGMTDNYAAQVACEIEGIRV